MKWIMFWTANKDMKVKHDLLSRMNNQSGWKRREKNSGLTGNGTLTFAMTGHIALPIKLIKPTVLLSTGTKRDPGEEKKAFRRRRGEPRD